MERVFILKVEGEVALITGGANGLGLAIANHLSKMGARIVIVDRDANALANLPDHMDRYELDVTVVDEVKSAIDQIVERYGQIGILVNNAGVIHSELFVNITKPGEVMHEYQRFRDSITANLDSVFIVTAAVVEKMVLSRTKGIIVNISSISACGNEGQTAYSAAKAGVNAMTVTWSKELGRLGIRCNVIAPGFIGTESSHKVLTESTVKHIKENTPLRRLGDAHDVAKAVASVIENDFINGVVLDVNGGLTI